MDTVSQAIIRSSDAIVETACMFFKSLDHRFLAKMALCMSVAYAVDKIASIRTKMRPLTRWYFIHSIGNAVISVLSLSDMLKVTKYPIGSFSGGTAGGSSLTNYRSYPIIVMSSMHLYHIVAYWRSMAPIDWIHHLLSGGVVGTACTFYVRGPVVNHGLFFMCGLPGMIDYIMLVMSDFGLIDRMTEKRINSDINVWIRAPGILFNCFVAWVCYIHDPTFKYNVPVSLGIFFLNIWNALYFAQRVVHNYGYHMGGRSCSCFQTPSSTTIASASTTIASASTQPLIQSSSSPSHISRALRPSLPISLNITSYQRSSMSTLSLESAQTQEFTLPAWPVSPTIPPPPPPTPVTPPSAHVTPPPSAHVTPPSSPK